MRTYPVFMAIEIKTQTELFNDFRILVLDDLYLLLMMLLTLYTNLPHLAGDVLKAPEDIKKVLASDNEKMALDVCDGSTITNVAYIRDEDIRVAKVGPLHIEVEWDIERPDSVVVDVNVELDPPLENKENFLGIVPLTVKGILWVYLHGLKER
jgi:hypothetical protein